MNHNSELDNCIKQKLNQEADNQKLIKRANLIIILGRFYHIPKENRNGVIKELEDKGLIKTISKFEVQVV